MLKIFGASPEDVSKDREALREIAAELNRGAAKDRGFIIEVVTWNDVPPDMGRAEDVILNWIGQFDIFVGIMGRRFGTDTGKYGAGTEEEFSIAYDRWATTGQKRPRLLFYFDDQLVAPPRNQEEVAQWGKVIQFKHEVRKLGLVREYKGHEDFKIHVRRDLEDVIRRMEQIPNRPLDAEPSSLKGQYWPVWRDAFAGSRISGESVEAMLYRTTRSSVKFMTISGRSIYNGGVEEVLASKPPAFTMRLLLFDWNSSQFAAKMREERRETDTLIEIARRKARDIANNFISIADGHKLNLEIKLYQEHPVWRMVITDERRAFVGYYPAGKRGYEGPMFVFDSDDPSGLFYPANHYFDIIWARSGEPLRPGDPRLTNPGQ